MDCIHLNPVRAGLVRLEKGEGVLDYEWRSVAGGYALPARQRPKWIAVESGLAAFGFADTASGQRRFVERLDRRAIQESEMAGVVSLPEGADARCSHLKRGWYWGTEEFSERLLKIGKNALGAKRGRGYRASLERKAHDLVRADELLAEGLAAAGLDGEELALLPGSDPRKVAVARAIWERTTVPQAWLAERLEMRSAANFSRQLRRERTGDEGQNLPG